jgi:hypothetical protein
MPDIITKRDKNASKNLSGWDKTISELKGHVRKLEMDIETCRQMKEAGEPWPEDQTTHVRRTMKV